MSEIAEALDDVAKKTEQGLSKDFSQAYHDVLKETEQGATKVADHVAENEANTVEDFTSGVGRGAGGATPRDPHISGGGPGGGEETGGGQSGPGQTSEGNGATTTGGDPVDVVSGQMITSAADLDLPGLLPLTLRRAYASGYAGGQWFGTGWSSTLDQRLHITTGGIQYAGDDAQTLHYVRPTAPGQQVLPADGARWPLTWERDTDTIRIEDPETGWTRHFAPSPALGSAVRPISALTDRNGHRIEYLHDERGLASEVRHSGGYRVAVDTLHTSAGPRIEALRLLDGTGNGQGTTVLTYGYDARGRLTEIVNSSGLALVYRHDDHDRITSWTDRNGFWYAYEYGDDGRVTRGHGPDGALAATFTYDDRNRFTTVTNSLGHPIEYHYDQHQHITAVIDPLGNTVRTEHDRYGRLCSYTDALGASTRYTFDPRGDIVRVERPNGTELRITWNALHRPVRIDTPDGLFWSQSYDGRGNRIELTDRAGATTRFGYDEAGRLTAVTNPLGHVTQARCNPAGLLIEAADPLGARTVFQRDAFGRTVAVTDSLGNSTRYTWTVEGKPASRTHPDGSTETWTYDGEGNTLTHTNPLGVVTFLEYTHFGLTSARTEAGGTRHSFTYDTELRLIRVTNPQGLTWAYAHDAAGRLVSETDFNNHTLSYTHDAVGRLVTRVNGMGQNITYGYDPYGNLISKNADGEITAYAYDTVGRLLTAAKPTVELAREYDPVGRLTAETVNRRTTSFSYDQLGCRTGRRTPSGNVSSWEYDSAGNPVSLAVAGHHITFEHDSIGRETTRNLGTDLTLAFAWDGVHRLTSQSLSASGTVLPLLRRAYTYRADGHLSGITDQDQRAEGQVEARRFDLDQAGRVTAVHAANWTETYAYDATGNLTAAAWPAHRDTAAVGERVYEGTQLRSAGRISYRYDEQGRITSRRHVTLSGQNQIWQYTWDAEDHLTEVVTPDGSRWRYLYDPLGRRIAKRRLVADGSHGTDVEPFQEGTDFTWDGWTLVEQTTCGPRLPGPYTLSWDYRGLHPIAQTERLAAGASQEEVDARFFAIVTDLVGTPTHLLSADGSSAWEARSTLWGLTTYPKGSSTNTPLRFPGQYYDPESRLHYNVHRYYDPATARFLTSDPLGLVPGPDAYAYVGNPFMFCDPFGLMRDPRGRYAHDPSSPPLTHNRDSEYPSGYRQSTHDEMVKNWTDEGLDQGTAHPVDVNGDPIPRDQLTWRDSTGQIVPGDQLTYEHLDPVVSHWNSTGYNTDRPARNDWYNDPANLEPMTRSQNSSGGAQLGQTYRQDTGSNYRCH